MASTTSPEPTEGSSENVYVLSLQKSMRAINKKLSGMAKTDAVIKENPDVSLDDLVAQRKINQDQKASALKKPHLQAQLITLEEQVQQYKKFDADLQQQLQKQKSELTSNHGEALEKLKSELQAEAAARSETELKSKLLIFSQFLRAAADRRNAEHDEEDDENRAFEGTLLLVYGGDQKAVDTALSLIEGSDEQVTSIEGSLLPVKCKFSQRIGCDFHHYLANANKPLQSPKSGRPPSSTHLLLPKKPTPSQLPRLPTKMLSQLAQTLLPHTLVLPSFSNLRPTACPLPRSLPLPPSRPRATLQARTGTQPLVPRRRTSRTATRSFPGPTKRLTPQLPHLSRLRSRRPLPAGPTMPPPLMWQASLGTPRHLAKKLQQSTELLTTASTRSLAGPEAAVVASVDAVTARVAVAVDVETVVAVGVLAAAVVTAKVVDVADVAVALAATATPQRGLRKPAEVADSAQQQLFKKTQC
jgi:hypothetical protein